VLSTPIPSPSMTGTIGLSGTGLPATIRSPSAGTLIMDVVLIEAPRSSLSVA
jgi:hypothetical protein